MSRPTSVRGPYLSVRAFAVEYGYPTERTIRHWIFTNLDDFDRRCCRRVGRSILLDVEAVWAWIDAAGSTGPRGGAR